MNYPARWETTKKRGPKNDKTNPFHGNCKSDEWIQENL
jgi:hypothetical protein